MSETPEARVATPDAVLADLSVPLWSGLQRQGDLLVIPLDGDPGDPDPGLGPGPGPGPGDQVSGPGVVLVRGESGGGSHVLVGDATWTPAEEHPDLGVVRVVTTAYLMHPEHAALGLAAGQYLVRRQREQAPSGPRLVAD